jgi:hypothetical protein
MKKLFASILLIVSQLAFAGDYEVWFVNGISNSSKDFEYSKLALRMAINNYKPSETNISISKDDVKGIYNPSNGTILGAGLTDIAIELPQIATLEAYIRKEADKRFPSNKQQADTEYSRIMGLAMIKYMPTSFDPAYSGVYSKTLSVVADIVGQIENRLQLGKKIVIVAHSQGNHMVALSYAALIAKNPAYANSMRVVGVAPVAATTPNNRYVTIDGDYTVQSLYKNFLGGNPLPSNATEVISEVFDRTKCTLLADILPGVKNVVTCFAANGHSFTDVYLNDYLLIKDTTVSLQHYVASMVWSSIIELSASQPVTFATLMTNGSYNLASQSSQSNGYCYYKGTGSLVATNSYSTTSAKYCLSGSQWVSSSDSNNELIYANGLWVPLGQKVIKSTGLNTYTVSYGGVDYFTGSYSQTGSVISHTMTQSAPMYVLNTDPSSYVYQNVPSLSSLITNYNRGTGGSYMSRGGQYGFVFAGTPSDTSGIIDYFLVGVTPRSVTDRGTWSKVSLNGGTEALVLGTNSTIITNEANMQAVYFKRPSDSGVREGGLAQAGRVQSWEDRTRADFDSYLQSLGLPATVN